MEKISGIIPTTPRVSSVNLKESQTVRPGAPSFGAPVGRAAINGGDQPTTAEKAVAAHNKLMARRSGDAHKPEIIKNMTDSFFMRNATEPAGIVEDFDLNFNMDMDSTIPRVQASEITVPGSSLQAGPVESMDSSSEEDWMIAESQGEAEEYTPPGSYLDVTA